MLLYQSLRFGRMKEVSLVVQLSVAAQTAWNCEEDWLQETSERWHSSLQSHPLSRDGLTGSLRLAIMEENMSAKHSQPCCTYLVPDKAENASTRISGYRIKKYLKRLLKDSSILVAQMDSAFPQKARKMRLITA